LELIHANVSNSFKGMIYKSSNDAVFMKLGETLKSYQYWWYCLTVKYQQNHYKML